LSETPPFKRKSPQRYPRVDPQRRMPRMGAAATLDVEVVLAGIVSMPRRSRHRDDAG
jgi:hypothetical protein